MLNASKLATSWGKKKQSSFQMRGINLSDNYSEWEFARMKGFSMRRFPYLSVRKKREEVEGYANVSSLKAWEKLVAVSGTDLIYDGQVVGQVTEGEKQFEIVNSKIVIMPDKKMLDISQSPPVLSDLGASSKSGGGAAGFDGNTITSLLRQTAGITTATFSGDTVSVNLSQKIAGFGAYYVNVTQMKLGEVTNVKVKRLHIFDDGIIRAESGESFSAFKKGDIFRIYRSTGSIMFYTVVDIGDSFIETSASTFTEEIVNDAVVYKTDETGSPDIHMASPFLPYSISAGETCNIMNVDSASTEGSFVLESADSYNNGTITAREGSTLPSNIHFGNFTMRKGSGFNYELNDILREGSYIAAFPLTGQEGKNGVVSSVTSNSLTIDGIGFNTGTSNAFSMIYSKWSDSEGEGGMAGFDKKFKVGDTVEIKGSSSTENNIERAVVSNVTKDSISFDGVEFRDGTEYSDLVIERRIPDFDFICESDNRLYGCVNSEQTIYASALGDPTNFFVDPTLSTGSYAVAVSSAGEFTGCCKYGSSVLFFKETKLHKLLGSYPAEYTLYSYDMEGVRKGCGKSLCVVNDTLLYLSLSGVFAYTGGTPSLISPQFGEHIFGEGVGGNDGDTYYLSAKDLSTNEWYLFLYETKYGTWVNEGYEQVKDFARRGEDFYMLLSDGKVYKEYGAAVDPSTEFEGITKPFREDRTSDGYSLKKKRYNKIIVRFTVGTGARVNLHYRFEGGMWQSAGYLNGAAEDIIQIPLNYNRADDLELKISGHGDVVILGIDMIYSERTVR